MKNETVLLSLPDIKFKKELYKLLTELKDFQQKCWTRTRNHKQKPIKFEDQIANMKTRLNTRNGKINNAEEWVSGLENRITKPTQSEQ